MSFNLNDSSFDGGVAIFNGGMAGKVESVKMSVEKKQPGDADNIPDYKLIFKQENGASINQGFYYHKNNDNYDTKRNADLERWTVSRVLSAAKSVVPNDFVFPTVSTSKEAMDSLFKIIKDNADEKLVNVFVTYGTTQKPSQYLGLRYFEFVEASNTPSSKLVRKNGDMMDKLVADAPTQNTSSNASASTDW
jgi:hypothetical protein